MSQRAVRLDILVLCAAVACCAAACDDDGGGGAGCEQGAADGGECEGEGAATCAPGTVREGGACVPACGEDEVWSGGDCVRAPECGDGTAFDEASGTCLPVCEEGEEWNGTGCVEPVTCGPGTALDEASGECVPDEDLCAPGTKLEDGVCVPDLDCGEGTHLEGSACVPDEEPPPDVPEAEGAAPFDIPAAGGSTTLGGAVDLPSDVNADGFTEADWDVFSFTAAAGMYLRLAAHSAGAARPAFIVSSEATDADGYALYARYALDPGGDQPAREIYLPAAGVYFVQVTDYNNLLAAVFGAGFLPVGGDDYTYRVTVENLGAPTVEEVSALPVDDSGDIADGRLRFYRLPGLAAKEVYEITLAGAPPEGEVGHIYPDIALIEPAGSVLREVSAGPGETASILFSVPADGSYLVVQDFLMTVGANRAFTFRIVEEPVADCTAGGCAGGSLDAGARKVLRFDLRAGDFFLFAATVPTDAAESLRVAWYDEDMAIVSDSSASPGWNRFASWYCEEDTWVYLVLEGVTGAAVPSYTFEAVLEPLPVLTDGAAAASVSVIDMPEGTLPDCGLARFEALAGQMAVFGDPALNAAPPAWIAPAHAVWTSGQVVIGPPLDTTDTDLPPVDPPMALVPADGTYLHRLSDQGTGSDIVGGGYDIALDLQDVVDLGAPVASASVSRTGETLLAATELAFYRFQAIQGTDYDIAVDPATSATVQASVAVFARGWHSGATWYWSDTSQELGRMAVLDAAAAGDTAGGTITAPLTGDVVIAVRHAGASSPTGSFDISVAVP